jgi:predicted metal-dependent hydrolase
LPLAKQNEWFELLDILFFIYSKEEIEKELKSLKNRKSPGPDGISNKMLKYSGTELTLHLTHLFQQILKLCNVPKAWKESIIIPIFKYVVKQIQILLRNYITKHYPKIIH